MDYKLLNEILKDLHVYNLKNNKELTLISEGKTHDGGVNDGEGNQGEYDEYQKVFRVNKLEDIYIKFTIRTDSYGDNEYIYSIQFVKPTVKTIQLFEPIN